MRRNFCLFARVGLFTLVGLTLVGCEQNTVLGIPSPSSTGTSATTYPATAFTQTQLLAGVPFVDSATSQGTADGVQGKFRFPTGIALDSNYYYVGDTGGHTVRRVNRATGAIQTIAGIAGVSGSNDGIGSVAKFGFPTGLLLSGTKLYVSDLYYSCIRTIDISDADFTVTTVLGLCGTAGDSDGTGTAALLNEPAGLLQVNGFLYIADWGNHLIRQVQLSNLQVVTIAGQSGAAGTTDDIGLAAQFNNPFALAYYQDPLDGGVLFIADENNHAIRRLALADRSVTTVVGTIGAPGFADGIGTSATLYGPLGVVCDGVNLYVADSGNYAIRKISLSDYSVTTLLSASPSHVDTFGTTLANSNFSGLESLYFDSLVGLLATTESALFRVK